MLDVIIIGGGVSGMSCAMVLGSAHGKAYAKDKLVAIIAHQNASSLQDAIFYNAYGVPSGKLGADLLEESTAHVQNVYPHIQQIFQEKVVSVQKIEAGFAVITNKNSYTTKTVVVGIGSSNLFAIEGLLEYVEPHAKSLAEKQRIQLRNRDHKVAEGIYVCGTLAGHRSQLPIAAGSGAAVATDILVLWNDGVETHSHDSVRK